jgi:hypothetical protein
MTTNLEMTPAAETREWRYAERAMTWYGWGSPVGAGIFLVGLGACLVLIRVAVTGL